MPDSNIYQSNLVFGDLPKPRKAKPAIKAPLQRSCKLGKPPEPQVLQALQNVSNVVFLDIETTGLSRHYDDLTVVGWIHDGGYHAHVAGDEPVSLARSLEEASVLVTFNGTLFDLPFLRKTFPHLKLPSLHADLRYLGRRAGLTGGQKAIERELGITHREGIEDVDGAEAVLLWHRYIRGDKAALRRLIEYNRCDVLGMRNLLDEVLNRLVVSPDLWLAATRFASYPYVSKGWADETIDLPCPSRLNRPHNTFTSLFAGTKAENSTIVGIDLTGSEKRASGWCLLRGSEAQTSLISTDHDLIESVVAAKPMLVSIDSPLSIPFGRISVKDDDPGRDEFGIMRRCERELKRRGINVYPSLLPSMQGLTARGIRLATELRRLGFPVIESYPGAAQDIMGIPRKGAGEIFLKQGLADFGITGSFQNAKISHDELDAITSALVGSFFLAGKFEALSGPTEDPLIIPDLKANRGSPVIGISGRIASGKTTTARLFEQHGFAYARFSLAVDNEIIARGLTPDRILRQKIGAELHNGNGQRWLAERTLKQIEDQDGPIVVDGLRFCEDYAYFVERFGSRFVHLHIDARREVRALRYNRDHPSGPIFDLADAAPVESEIARLADQADIVLKNHSGLDLLVKATEHMAVDLLEGSRQACPSQSS